MKVIRIPGNINDINDSKLEKKGGREIYLLEKNIKNKDTCLSLREAYILKSDSELLIFMDYANGGSLDSFGRNLKEIEIYAICK